MATLAMSMNGLPIRAFGEGKFLNALAKSRNTNGNILVLVRLSGGNDGLNTIIPLDRYAELTAARSNVLIPQNDVLPLTGTTTTGLHPYMTGLQSMYDDGLVNIVQGVSYPNPSLSHFRSTDIVYTGSDSNQFQDTGWVGRYIDNEFPGAPQAYPDPDFLSPLAIQIGSTVSTMLAGANGINGLAVSSVSNFYNIVTGQVDPAPNTPAGHELSFIRYIAQQTQAYTQVLQQAASQGTNLATYPTGNRLAAQLKIVAQLVSGGLETPVFVVEQGGYDTHDNQVDSSNQSNGQHAALLGQLSDAIAAFQEDLKLLGKDDIVTGCTFSEFGRRIRSNASNGTDHGVGAPMIVFGKQVNPTIIGTSPVLPANATNNDHVPMQHDFRQVYSTILQDWFDISPSDTANILNGNTHSTLPIFKGPTSVENVDDIAKNVSLEQNFPNPVVDHTTIRFTSSGGAVQITLYDMNGRRVREIYQNQLPPGTFDIDFNRESLPAGTYIYEFVQGSQKIAKQMIIAG